MNYDFLLLIQIGGLFMAYSEHEELFNCSKLKLVGRLFIIFLPILLYINLLFLDK